MPIVQDITLVLDPADVLRRQEGSPGGKDNPALLSLTEDMLRIATGQGLIRHALVYEMFSVANIRDGRVLLAEGAVLEGRRLAKLFASAERVAAVMCTLGPDLDARVSALHEDNAELESVLLDGIGNAAMDALAREACLSVKQSEESGGRQASGPLSPGLFGLPMENQTVLHRLAGGERIGIRLTPGLMMVPNKSLSLLIGIGKDMQTWDHAQACSWCNLKESCAYRVSRG